jgi:L-iditol 2-dehydrogenase
MRALRKLARGKGNMALVDCAVPEISDEEVLISVKALGVCGTDYHIFTDEYPTSPPLTVGHEFSGEIVKMGNRVTGLKQGMRVISELSVKSCGTCVHCKTGNPHICPAKKPPGSEMDGACAEFVKMPYKLIHEIPENVTFEEAAVVEPAAIVVHGVLERAKVLVNDFVVVAGAGPIGLLAAQAARIAGARRIVILGTDNDQGMRFEAAKKLGFQDVINVSRVNAVEEIEKLTGGKKVDVFIECSGSVQAINTGIDVLRKHGRMCVIGIPGRETLEIKWKKAVLNALEIIFSFSSSSTSWSKVLSLISSRALDVKSLISHIVDVGEWESIFDKVSKGEVLKAVLRP